MWVWLGLFSPEVSGWALPPSWARSQAFSGLASGPKRSLWVWCLLGVLWVQESMLLSVYITTGRILRPWGGGPRHCDLHPPLASRPAGAPEAPILVVGNKRDRQRLRFGPRRALAALVRRGWRCGYLECSAKYNWHVLRLFRELLRCALVRARPAHPALRLQGALHPARCSLM